jgi:hypothetical protein
MTRILLLISFIVFSVGLYGQRMTISKQLEKCPMGLNCFVVTNLNGEQYYIDLPTAQALIGGGGGGTNTDTRLDNFTQSGDDLTYDVIDALTSTVTATVTIPNVFTKTTPSTDSNNSIVTGTDGSPYYSDPDDDAGNELQTLSLVGDQLTLSDGGGTFKINITDAVVETVVAGTNVVVDATDPANPVFSVPSLNDADFDPTNELPSYTSSSSPPTITGTEVAGDTHTDTTTGDVYEYNGSTWGKVGNTNASGFTSVVAGTNVTIDNTDANNPILNVPSLDDADADPTNELLTGGVLSGTDLQLTDAGGTTTVDLSPLSGGAADGTPTSGAYDSPNSEIDITVAAPGTSFSIDVSALAETGDIPTNVSQLTNDSGFLTAEVDGSTTNELQTLDVSQLSGTNLELSLSNDGVATEVIDLSSLQGTDDQTSAEVSFDPSTSTLVSTNQQDVTVELVTNQNIIDQRSSDNADSIAVLRTDLDAIASGASDGVVTAGVYDVVNDEIDFTVSSPGTNFSVDLSGASGESTTVTDGNTVNLTLTGSDVTAEVIPDPVNGGLSNSATGLAFNPDGANTYDNTNSGATATTLQTALDEALDETGIQKFIIVSGVGGVYAKQAEFICDGIDDQVQLQAAMDSTAARKNSMLFIDGTLTVSDSLSIRADHNYDMVGYGWDRSVIKTASGWASGTALFSYDFTNDTLDYFGIKNLSLDATTFPNNAGSDKGVILQNQDNHIREVVYDHIKIVGTGDYNVGINHSYSDTNNPGTFGSISFRNKCWIEMQSTGRTGTYAVRIKNNGQVVSSYDCDYHLSGTPGSGNAFNAFAAYGYFDELILIGNRSVSDVLAHSNFAASQSNNVRMVGNYAVNNHPNVDEGCYEFEIKREHSAAGVVDTVRNAIFTGNIAIIGENPAQTNHWGFFLGDRDTALPGATDTIPVENPVVIGNVIRNATIGIYAEHARAVAIGMNSYDNVNTHVNYGTTHLHELTTIATTEVGNLQLNGSNSSLALYDRGLLTWEPFLTQLTSGTNRYRFGDFINHYGDLNRVDFGDVTTQVTTRFFSNRFEIINSDLSVYIGEQAGDNATGIFGTFGGYRGGRYNTATSNAGWGAQIMSTNLFDGARNSGLGVDALQKAQSANDNTGGGYRNMQELTTGDQMASWGSRGFQFATSASNSTGGGYRHGYYENSSQSVLFGAFTGKQVAPAHSLTGLVLIGYNVGEFNTQSNRFMLDNTNTETPLLDGRLLADSLIVNGDLEVTGNLYENGNRVSTFEQYQENFTAAAAQTTFTIAAVSTTIDVKDIEVFWGVDNISLVKILEDGTEGFTWDPATKTVTMNGVTISAGDKLNVTWNE